jgi:hypothetical protein
MPPVRKADRAADETDAIEASAIKQACARTQSISADAVVAQ